MALGTHDRGLSHQHGSSLQRHILYTVLTFTLMTWRASAFNVDVENVKVISGQVNGSHFGFSVYLHRKTSGQLSLVVGAPGQGEGDGLVYTMELQQSELGAQGQPRLRALLTEPSNVRIINKWNETNMDGEMFGFYVGGNGQYSMVCAPHWADVKNSDYAYMLLGRCVFYDRDFNRAASRASQEPLYTANNVDYFKLYQGVPNARDNDVFNAQAEMGMAADITSEGTSVVGLPGRAVWSGGFLMSNQSGGNFPYDRSGLDDGIPTYSYLGYAVSMADFCKAPRLCMAAGAPRYMLNGGVFVYERVKTQFMLLTNVTGFQLGSYFGAAVLGADVDGEAGAELLVGAPFFTADSAQAATDKKTRFADEGRVYVFKNTRPQVTGQLEFKLLVELEGSNAGHARFGSSIANVGDLNHDGFNDIAVGAPREEEGRGALYIYQGGPDGPHRTASQRVAASSLHQGLRSFAHFIAKPLDMDNNTYPDIAVGSHMSDHVVLLRTRPILDLQASLSILPPLILPNNQTCSRIRDSDGCFQIRLCFNYTGSSLPDIALVKYDLRLDTQAKRSRRILVQEGDRGLETVGGNMTATLNRDSCVALQAVSLRTPRQRDPFTIVRVEADFRLHQPVLPPGNLQPIVNSSRPSTIQAEAGFSSGCRKQTECETDLTLQLTPRFLAGEPFVTINVTKQLELEVLLRNKGELAYSTTVDLDWGSADLRYLDVKANLQDNRLVCDPGPETSTGVKCAFQQQVNPDDNFRFTLVLNSSAVSPMLPVLNINGSAASLSKELAPLDNMASSSLPVWIVANVSLTGLSSPTGVGVPVAMVQAANKPVPQEVAHTYTLFNRGPSYLPSPTLVLAVPYYTLDRKALLIDANAEIKLSDGSSQVCAKRLPQLDGGQSTTSPSDGRSTTSSPHVTSGRPGGGGGDEVLTLPPIIASRRRRSAEVVLNAPPDDDHVAMNENAKHTRLSCAEAMCASFECRVSKLDPGASFSVNLTLTVDVAALPLTKENGSLWLETEGKLLQPDHPRFLPWNTNITTTVATRFDPVISEAVAIWIIILAVLGGVLLLVLLGILFWKCGFFKREKKDQVQQWKRQSMMRKSMADRRSMMPENGKSDS